MSPRRITGSVDQLLLLVAGLLMFVGAQLHPRASLDLSFREVEAATLSADRWEADHLLILVCLVCLWLGVALMMRRRPDRTERRLLALMLAGTTVLVPEMVVHTLMASEAHAVGAGGATPLFDIHLVLQAIGTPLFGAGVVGFAIRAGLRRSWGGPVLMVFGVVGGVAFGVAGPLVALSPASWDMLLFIGLVPLAVWLALSALLQLRRGAVRAPVANASSPAR